MLNDPLSDGGKLSYVSFEAHLKDERSKIDRIKDNFVTIKNAWLISRTNAINRLLLMGMEWALKEIEESTGDEKVKAELRLRRIVSEKMREHTEIRLQVIDLAILADEIGEDEFIKFCESEKIDYEGFCKGREKFIRKKSAPKQTQAALNKMSSVMYGFLLGYFYDRDMTHVNRVREVAKAVGVVTTDDDLNTLSMVAYRKKFSGQAPKNFWQMPDSLAENEAEAD